MPCQVMYVKVCGAGMFWQFVVWALGAEVLEECNWVRSFLAASMPREEDFGDPYVLILIMAKDKL